ncbi:hypothetical protein PROFUN_11406 [Planoprotostelium fungivorum]|uniref:Uncharacterized protein n=1 Tax=Planoprotostelium fungivorum TaxID=1890364 RepID=A0A2P6NA67_9EUKA|nr:hypothetical protein PROFUN_11406 [Planoprotostelium fungivorum]
MSFFSREFSQEKPLWKTDPKDENDVEMSRRVVLYHCAVKGLQFGGLVGPIATVLRRRTVFVPIKHFLRAQFRWGIISSSVVTGMGFGRLLDQTPVAIYDRAYRTDRLSAIGFGTALVLAVPFVGPIAALGAGVVGSGAGVIAHLATQKRS